MRDYKDDIIEAKKIGLGDDIEGLALALAKEGKLNEWNEAISALYRMADSVEFSHAFDPEFGFTHEKALRLRGWIACIPHVGA